MNGKVIVNGSTHLCPALGDSADPRRCLSCARMVEVHGHRDDAYVWCRAEQPTAGAPVGVALT